MKHHPLTRRELIEKCIAAGLLTAAFPFTASSLLHAWEQAEQQKLKPTPSNTLGPFYRPGAPRTTNLLVDEQNATPLLVTGIVWNTAGQALPDAALEVFHADPRGEYDNEGFRYRGLIQIGSKGEYRYTTAMPGHYVGRPAQHIHYRISAPGHRPLITQLYFATDPAFKGDPAKNYVVDRLVETPELIRPVEMQQTANGTRAAVRFELVLEKA